MSCLKIQAERVRPEADAAASAGVDFEPAGSFDGPAVGAAASASARVGSVPPSNVPAMGSDASARRYSQTPLMALRGVGVSYGRGPETVSGVDLEVFPGEILGLVGESGSGKSTLAKCMAGFLAPSSGEMTLAPAACPPAKGPRKVQMVFQDPASSFDPRYTLGLSVAEGLRNAGLSRAEARQRAAALFERCGLSCELLDRYPHQVSGGQCQRAAIARALAADPAILIADEATSALDVTVQARIVELLGRLNAELGMAIVFICHDPALVESFCTRVATMHAGRLVG